MKREFLRLAWRTVRSWRRSTPDPPTDRPGDDSQFQTWPRIRIADLNLQDQQDDDETRWTP